MCLMLFFGGVSAVDVFDGSGTFEKKAKKSLSLKAASPL